MKLVAVTDNIFSELFTISFSHSLFDKLLENKLSEHLTIIPDEFTGSLLRNYHLHYSFSNDLFGCYMQCRRVNNELTAFITPVSTGKLRFYITASTYFMNNTRVKAVSGEMKYYFNNRNNKATGMLLSQADNGVGDDDILQVPDKKDKQDCWGVVDIFFRNAVNASYELFTGAENILRRPEYRLLFRSN